MTNSPQQPPAGWYPDPAGSGGERFWDGGAWSQSTRDKEVPEPATEGGYGIPTAGQQPGQQQPYADYSQQSYGAQQNYGGQPGYGAQQPGYGMQQSWSPQPGFPRPAGFWWRLLGYLLDGLVLLIPNLIVGSVTGATARLSALTEQWLNELLIWSENPVGPAPELSPDFTSVLALMAMLQVVVWIIYRILMYRYKAATVGMMAVGAKLVPAADEHAPLSWTTIIVRAIASPALFAFSLLGLINGLFAAFTPRKQTIADYIARTVVLKIR